MSDDSNQHSELIATVRDGLIEHSAIYDSETPHCGECGADINGDHRPGCHMPAAFAALESLEEQLEAVSDIHVPDEWAEPDESRGVELSIEESIALWHFMQRGDVPPYWDDPLIASLTNKLKTFHKYGPWESGDSNQDSSSVTTERGGT